jgi:hypothetical protein
VSSLGGSPHFGIINLFDKIRESIPTQDENRETPDHVGKIKLSTLEPCGEFGGSRCLILFAKPQNILIITQFIAKQMHFNKMFYESLSFFWVSLYRPCPFLNITPYMSPHIAGFPLGLIWQMPGTQQMRQAY